MDPNDKQLCKCGHDLDLHGASGCTAGNSNGRQCWCSRSPNGVLALFAPPKPSLVSLQPVRERDVDTILGKFWTVQEHHQAEHEEQMRILRERRAQSGRKFS
jgi:hypothetical protein